VLQGKIRQNKCNFKPFIAVSTSHLWMTTLLATGAANANIEFEKKDNRMMLNKSMHEIK